MAACAACTGSGKCSVCGGTGKVGTVFKGQCFTCKPDGSGKCASCGGTGQTA